MVRILEKPAALSFSGNLTKFLVESDQPFTFSLKKKSAASSIFEHTYYPGTDKRSRIDVSNIIEDYLYFTLQANENVHLQPNIKGVFVATIDSQTVEFEVIRGGISNLADITTNWLKHNFLTWQPIEKNMTYHSPEWISWYSVSACALMLDATFEDQSRKSIKITDCQPGNVYTANLQYGYIAGLLGKLPSYYDVYLLYTDSQKSQVQRYLASDPKNEDEIYVGWENSLGGYDVARMSGYSTYENEGKHELGSNGDLLEEYNTELSKKHVCNTGLMTLNERFWFVDFFISKRRHVYIDNAMREIVLSEDKGSIDTAETIDGLSFTFREKENSKYLNVPRLRELPSDITIPVPSLPDFNLPPRLVEYARITLDEGVLFPAQHQSSQTCGVTTWGAMSTIINKWITDAIAGIKFPDIPDIPETLPPGPHTHQINDVVQLKTELEKRLLKETFDALFRYDATLDCLFVSKPIAVQGGVTMYADAGTLDLPSIYDGIPLGDGLIWKDGKIVVAAGGLDEAALDSYLTTHKYATQTWVTSQLSSLHTHSNKSVLDTITSGKIAAWDSKESALGNPATNGYLLSSTTAGVRSWVKPYELTKDDVVRVLKDADGCIRLDASMLLSGGLTMLSDLGFDVPSIFDNAPIATPTSKGVLDNSILGTGLSWEGGKLTATATAGTFDHTALSNRNAADQHSIRAITGLQAALDGKSPVHSHPYLSIADAQSNYWHNDNSNLDTVDWSAKALTIANIIKTSNGWSNNQVLHAVNGAIKILYLGNPLLDETVLECVDYNSTFIKNKSGRIWNAGNSGTASFSWHMQDANVARTINQTCDTERWLWFIKRSDDSHYRGIKSNGKDLSFWTNGASRFYVNEYGDLATNGKFYSGQASGRHLVMIGELKDEIVLLSGGLKGENGSPSDKYPVSAFENYGWNFTIQGIGSGQFGIWNATRTSKFFHIGSNGKVGIGGVTTPSDMLHIRGSMRAEDGINVDSGTAKKICFQVSNNKSFYLNQWFNIVAKPDCTASNTWGVCDKDERGLLTVNAVTGLVQIANNLFVGGGITMLSDMRMKNRISNAKSVLPYISSIDVFRYTLKADVAKRIYIGVSAQQIQGIWSEFVHGVETLSLDYAQMAAYVAIKGLQETKLWMDRKDKKIAELENRIVELEKNAA